MGDLGREIEGRVDESCRDRLLDREGKRHLERGLKYAAATAGQIFCALHRLP